MSLGPTRLSYLTANPITEGWDYRQKVREQQEAHELEMSAKEAALAETMAAGPLRVQQQRANTRLATTNADVAEQTAPYKVTQERTQAEQGEFDLSRDRQFLPYDLRSKEAGAAYDEANAAVARGTVGSRISASRSQAATAAANAEEASAWKEERFLRLAGEDPEAAEAWAAQAGLDVPPQMRQLVRDRRFMALSKGTMDAIESVYGTGDENLVTRYTEYTRIMQGLMGQAGQPPASESGSAFYGMGADRQVPDAGEIPSLAEAYRQLASPEASGPIDPTIDDGGDPLERAKDWQGYAKSYAEAQASSWSSDLYAGRVRNDASYQRNYEEGLRKAIRLDAEKRARQRISGSIGSIRTKADEFQRLSDQFYEDGLRAMGLDYLGGDTAGGAIDGGGGSPGYSGTYGAPLAGSGAEGFGAGTEDDPLIPQTQADIDSAPSGTVIQAPDGTVYVVP
jgi:hypothetical protein